AVVEASRERRRRQLVERRVGAASRPAHLVAAARREISQQHRVQLHLVLQHRERRRQRRTQADQGVAGRIEHRLEPLQERLVRGGGGAGGGGGGGAAPPGGAGG